MKNLLFMVTVTFSFTANSAYTEMVIEGVKQSNGVWTTAGVMDTQGFVRTTGAVTVSGATRNLPVAISADVGLASTMLKGVARSAGPIALAATAYDLYQWYNSNGLTDSAGQWGVLTGDITFSPETNGYAQCAYLGGFNTTVADCVSRWQRNYPNYYFTGPMTLDPSLSPNPYCGTNDCTYRFKQTANIPSASLGFDIVWPKSKTTSPFSNTRPSTDVDFNKLPIIPTNLISSSWGKFPALTGKTPIKGVEFTPYSEWKSDPYFKDGQWWRDRMDVSPSSIPGQPTRVRIDVGPVKLNGYTDPTVKPPETPASSTTPKEKEQTKFCDDNPQSIACAQMGELEKEEIETKELPVSTAYTPWGSSNSSCPASRTISLFAGKSVTISYQPICDFVTMLRPLIIGLALISAMFIIGGISRSGGGE